VSNLLFVFLVCAIVATFIHIWFYSDAVAYYLKLMKPIMPKRAYDWLLVDPFFDNPDPDIYVDSYIEYLYIKISFSKNFKLVFVLKMLSCPTCFTVWASILVSLISGSLLLVGAVFIVLRLLDFILRFVLKKAI